ncbi:hypothetical protein E4U57_004868 [Claviceps arundinis]|uniref:Uncharacterized protein n=1 Tax=Claviceps arundinis TaxID=1623583 RepID=A0A9P7MUK2_9HYPO|nr:hypothetical protein E4U57_004868 [Claviceps arundinis]KAG5969527.1 hypothetical protein E4U56_008285 [Claviceps arundinis]
MYEEFWPSTDKTTLNNARRIFTSTPSRVTMIHHISEAVYELFRSPNATVTSYPVILKTQCMDSSSALLIISLVVLLNPVMDVTKTSS